MTNLINDAGEQTSSRAMLGGRTGLILLITIGALASALMVIFVLHAREASREMQCRDNLRRLGIGFHSYCDIDWVFSTEVNGSGKGIFTDVLPNLGNDQELFICSSRRDPHAAIGKRDYGYAASSGGAKSIFDTDGGVSLIVWTNASGKSPTVLLSHVWMEQAHYYGGDPTDLGWATLNNSRSINNTAICDFDPRGALRILAGRMHKHCRHCFTTVTCRTSPTRGRIGRGYGIGPTQERSLPS
jgi:hypothetical protein